MAYVDMHIHSCYSDGVLTLNEILTYMNSIGVSELSITDHNSIKVYQETPTKSHIRIITGVELDVFHDIDFQILCYNYQINYAPLNKILQKVEESRTKACVRIISNMKKLGIYIPLDSPLFSMIHNYDYFCDMLVENGLASCRNEAKIKYFDRDGILYQNIYRPSAQECIQTIKQAGGVSILAHPGRISTEINYLENLIYNLIDIGIEGVECYHPDHSPQITQSLKRIAQKYKLIVAGGSDMHERETTFRVKKSDLLGFIQKCS